MNWFQITKYSCEGNKIRPPNRMSNRARALRRLLFRVLPAALLLVSSLVWARLAFSPFLPGAESTIEASAESFVDDPEVERLAEVARPAARTRMCVRRRVRATSNVDARAVVRVRPSRLALVVDFRPIKPKHSTDPPYLQPRVVRLLN